MASEIGLCQSLSSSTGTLGLCQSLSSSTGTLTVYTCGDCRKGFSAICILHSHLMLSRHGGSFYYDHVTRTAYPRYDAVCSSTQTCDVDHVQDGKRLLCAVNEPEILKTCEAQIKHLENRRQSKVRRKHENIESNVKTKSVKLDMVSELTVKRQQGKLENRNDSKVKKQGKNRIPQQLNRKFSKYQFRPCFVRLEMIGNGSSVQQTNFSKCEKSDGRINRRASLCDDQTDDGVRNTADKIVSQNHARTVGTESELQGHDDEDDDCSESKETEYNQLNKTDFNEDLDELEDSYDEIETTSPELHIRLAQTESELVKNRNRELFRKDSSVGSEVVTKGNVLMEEIFRGSDNGRTLEDVAGYPEGETKSSGKNSSCSLSVQLTPTKDTIIEDKIKVTSTWIPDSLREDTDSDVTMMIDERSQAGQGNGEIDSVNKEIKMVENKNNYSVCDTCGRSVRRENIEGHLNGHSGNKPYICDTCGKAFPSMKTMLFHKKLAHAEKDQRKKCPHCDKTFAMDCLLKRHMLVHAGKKVFTCRVCGKGFNYERSQKEHEKNIHGSAELHQCPVCEKEFKWKNNWHTHVESHSKVHPCSVCGMQFSHLSSMKRHLKTHTKVKPHSCHICGRGFVQKTPYWVHMDRHHDLTKEDLVRMFPQQHGHVISQTVVASSGQSPTPETLQLT